MSYLLLSFFIRNLRIALIPKFFHGKLDFLEKNMVSHECLNMMRNEMIEDFGILFRDLWIDKIVNILCDLTDPTWVNFMKNIIRDVE